jgi:hypothetical protein
MASPRTLETRLMPGLMQATTSTLQHVNANTPAEVRLALTWPAEQAA